ncbi:MAG: 3-dehydroquinate synthase [bacterium]|nr:3-dehydroquinate synthase [bacterium]
MIAHELILRLGSREIPVRHSANGVAWAASEVRRLVGGKRPRVCIVTDERVALHYESELRESLRTGGFRVSVFAFPPGEAWKTWQTLSRILDQLADEQFARDDLIIGLGGGVVTDMAGFAAAIYKRGMNWIAVPTSLMAMADAALGGKTGVNHPLGKNLIGVFHQPLAMLAPLNVLATLEEREWRSGAAEIVKCALLSGAPLWNCVRDLGVDLLRWPTKTMNEAVRLAAETKIELVSQDERDVGVRRFLNFGHSFAHALESATGYAQLSHGAAVFLGMRAAVRMSFVFGVLDEKHASEIETVLAAAIFPAARVKPDRLLTALVQDKKTTSDALHWVLLSAVGEPVIRADVPRTLVAETAEWLCGIAAQGKSSARTARRKRILVVNGPNLNLLGLREPNVYGSESYEDLLIRLTEYARERDVELLLRQSNLEGDLVEIVQRARHWADGIVINPGGYTHTSVALRDALAAVEIPAIEVHLSDLEKREPFRQMSLTAEACRATIMGQGVAGYAQAMNELIGMLNA